MCDVGKPTVGMVPASDTTPLAMPSKVVVSFDLVSDQLQWVASPVHGELSTEAGSFNQHYSVGYVHQFAFDPGVENLMVIRFGLGSSSGYDYSPSAMHVCYGYETMAGELQSCADCNRCTMCVFSVSSVVS